MAPNGWRSQPSAVALRRVVEQTLPALRATAQCAGTPSVDKLVYHLEDRLTQFVKPQASVIGAGRAARTLVRG